jgi:hypothetical protein
LLLIQFPFASLLLLFGFGKNQCSFGIVVWETLQRERPYTGIASADLIRLVCDEKYRLPRPNLFPFPDELWDLIQQ